MGSGPSFLAEGSDSLAAKGVTVAPPHIHSCTGLGPPNALGKEMIAHPSYCTPWFAIIHLL